MDKNNFNWDKFTHSIYLNADPEKVFVFVGTASGISKWFIGKAEYFYGNKHVRLGNDFAQKGDSYLWKWLNKDLELKGMVIDIIENSEFKFTFSPLYIVTIKIIPEKGRTKLLLTQEYQESAVKNEFNYLNCCVCWVFFLTNLKSVIENGTDLREKKETDEMIVNM